MVRAQMSFRKHRQEHEMEQNDIRDTIRDTFREMDEKFARITYNHEHTQRLAASTKRMADALRQVPVIRRGLDLWHMRQIADDQMIAAQDHLASEVDRVRAELGLPDHSYRGYTKGHDICVEPLPHDNTEYRYECGQPRGAHAS